MPVTEPYIDAHSHIWTPDVAHYPLAEGFRVRDMTVPAPRGTQVAICVAEWGEVGYFADAKPDRGGGAPPTPPPRID